MESTIPSFADLEGDLDAVEIDPNGKRAANATFLNAQTEFAATYRCERCNGAGRKFGGICYRCNGSGKQNRKPVDRSAPALAKRAQTKARKEERRQTEVIAYQKEHAAVFDWVHGKAPTNSFASSLLAGFLQYGRLTDRQIEAVEHAIVEDERRAQERKERAEREATEARTREARAVIPPPSPDNALDLSAVPAGRYAIPGGNTRLKVLIQKPTPPNKWSGYTFVSDAAGYGARRKYGLQAPHGFYKGHIVAELRIIASDPKAAAIAYGRLTGTCCICGRMLEDPNSIEAGIGPVCAERFA